jgi:hypothetical protein
VVSAPWKNMKVSWDDDIPNIWENKINVPNPPARSFSPTINGVCFHDFSMVSPINRLLM